jgi:hypothetical protein
MLLSTALTHLCLTSDAGLDQRSDSILAKRATSANEARARQSKVSWNLSSIVLVTKRLIHYILVISLSQMTGILWVSVDQYCAEQSAVRLEVSSIARVSLLNDPAL